MMKSLHFKKLAGVGEKMRTWGKASEDEPQPNRRHGHRRRHSHGHDRRSESPPPPPTPSQHEELPFSDEGDDPGVLSPASSGNEEDLTREALASSGSSHTSSSTSPTSVSLLDDTPLLPALPPLPPNARRRGSLDSSSEALLIDVGEPLQHPRPQRHQHHHHEQHQHPHDHHHHHPQPHPQPPSPVATSAHGDKGHKLEDRIKALKLREMALRDERNQERQRRKEAERQLKAMQKDRYIQGLKIKYLETKLEKLEKKDGGKTDMERRIKKEAQTNIALQKEVDTMRAKLAEKEKALAEKEEAVARAKARYSRLKHGGTDECSLQALEELDRQLEKSRNALLERIKLRLKEEADDKAKCAICYDRARAIIFVPCGHRVCCTQCSNQVKACPICRANIDIRQKVFD